MRAVAISSLERVAAQRKAGYVDAVLAAADRRSERFVYLGEEAFARLRAEYALPAIPGPGAELKTLLRRLGIVAKAGCACNQRAKIMDEQGCDWCEENIDTISGWLAEESKKRKLPYMHAAGKLLIRLAIRRARKMGSNH
jgi:hypothetical protein